MFFGCLPCCGAPPKLCVLQTSGEIAGYPGSSVSFDDGGAPFRFLNYFGVYGYWLGFRPDSATQSVTFSFGAKKPTSVEVRVSALNDAQRERFNYSFSGADSVVFTIERGDEDDFTFTESTVTRQSNGDTRFKLAATGQITSVFVEGEMINNGANGIIVEVCFFDN